MVCAAGQILMTNAQFIQADTTLQNSHIEKH